MKKLTTTQKVGLGIAGGGAVAVVAATGIAGYLFTQNMKVGATPSDIIMQIIGLLFGGGGSLTIGGIITAIISWFRNRNTPTPNTTLLPSNTLGETKASSLLNIPGVTGAELIELTESFISFITDRTSVPKQKRLIMSLTGIGDVIPNLKTSFEEGQLFFVYRLFPVDVPTPLKTVPANSVLPSSITGVN